MLSGSRVRRWVSFAPPELDLFRVWSHGLRRGLHSFAALRLGLSLSLPLGFYRLRLLLWLGLLVGARILLWPRGRGRPRHTCLLRLRHGRLAVGRIRGVRSDIGGGWWGACGAWGACWGRSAGRR